MRKLFGWLKRTPPKISIERNGTYTQKDGHDQQGHYIAAAIHRFQQYQQTRHEAEDREAHKEYRWVKATGVSAGIAAVATAIAAVFTGLNLQAANRQTDIAQQTFVASSRAWIHVSAEEKTASFVWHDIGTNQTGIKIGTIHRVNEGSSPATHVINTMKLRFEYTGLFTGNPWQEAVKGVCTESEQFLWNISIFMKEDYNIGMSSNISDSEIETYFADTHQNLLATFEVIICTTYKVIGDNKFHHTGIIYKIGTTETSYIMRPNVNLAQGSVTLIQEHEGDYID